VVVDPAEYETVLEEIRARGHLSRATRRRLARAAFAHTAAYDAAIVEWFDTHPAGTEKAQSQGLPPTVHLALEQAQELRYGENPHQQAARYRRVGTTDWWDQVVQHGGMALSYLNLVDADAAWALVHDLGDAPAAAIIKHANPCGAAVATTAAEAYRRAFECDPMSAFGGIVALNRPVDDDLAEEMVANPKADVVVSPGYSPGAVERFAARRKNMRVLEAPPPDPPGLHLRQIGSGFLAQEPYRFGSRREGWKVATNAVPTDDQWRDLELAWRICAHVKSNAIVLVTGGMAVGVGAGQQNRVEAGELAVRKAGDRAKGGAAASDAFFPFRDGLDALASAGVTAVIQPGGSIRDEELVAAADEHGIAMVLTGERQFRH
jgi:phosphoribosylaminoimidazolecarboxamide formyltransferase/IMP cyclohydrolase